MSESTGQDGALIRFADVHKEFVERETTRVVLRQFNATVNPGETVTIVGPSGSGKSTLLSLCNLLLTPDKGEVHVLGKEIRSWDIPELRRTVGMVFQTPTVFPGTVYDNLNLGPKLRDERVHEPEKWMAAVDLPEDWLSRHAEELSGGQRQRIALVRTLINQPRILLLDEVTSALDAASTQVVEGLIGKWKEETGGTVLWVTHHLHQARRQGTTTWLIQDGELVEGGPTPDLFANPKDERTRTFLADHVGDASMRSATDVTDATGGATTRGQAGEVYGNNGIGRESGQKHSVGKGGRTL